jgi:Icc-related predicted phosphoesterase
MRILAVSDLHFQEEHFAWVAKQACNYDLVIIAGDLLDLFAFGRVSIDKQVRQVTSFLTDIRLNCNALAVCSGNHDLWATRDLRWLQQSPSRSLAEEKLGGTFIADGASAIVPGSRLLVTCCPWAAETEEDAERLTLLLEQGEALRSSGTDAWLWVCHEPPHLSRTGRTLAKNEGSELISRLILKHQPDFVFGGHVHGAPFDGGMPFDQIGNTWCFNPGCPDRRKQLPEPPNIILDLDAGQAVWRWGSMEKRAYIETPVTSFASAA